jgi:hypothetical protein
MYFFFNLHGGGVESKLGPLGTSATHWPIVPAPGDCEDGEFGGMNGSGNRSTRRKPAPTPLWPPQIPLHQTRDWTRAAATNSFSYGAASSPMTCTEQVLCLIILIFWVQYGRVTKITAYKPHFNILFYKF